MLFLIMLVILIVLQTQDFWKKWRKQGYALTRGWKAVHVILNLATIPLLFVASYFSIGETDFLSGFIPVSIAYMLPSFIGYWISLRFRSDRNFPSWYMILPAVGMLILFLSVLPDPRLKPPFGVGTLLLAVFFLLRDFTILRRSGERLHRQAVLQLFSRACMFLPVALYMLFSEFFDSLIPNAEIISFVVSGLVALFHLSFEKDKPEWDDE